MESLQNYINEKRIDEGFFFSPLLLKRIGLILLSTVVPYLISLGVKISNLHLDDWVLSLQKKFPKHKDAIKIMANVLSEYLNKSAKGKSFITNTEKQQSSGLLTTNEIKKDLLPLISNDEDKKKVNDLLDLIDSDEFKEKIDESF